MKRVNNIYDKICDLDNIMDMAHKVCLNTKNKKKVDRFETFYVEEIIYIKKMLENRSYEFSKYNIFLIKEPKVRLIMSESIRDKIVNHLVSKYFLVDVFDSSFIESNIATRKGKGTHYGLSLIKRYLNEIKRDNKEIYYLKVDIKKYFYNIDHDILKRIIRTKIKDRDALSLIDYIIDSTDEEYINKEIIKVKDNEINRIKSSNLSEKDKRIKIEEIESIPLCKKGKSCSIGNMSSQIFGILYLSELDHFIKEKLHIKYHLRYMDDIILIHNDREYLKYCLSEIIKVLDKYKLEINSKKTYVGNIKCGLDVLGFMFYIKNNKTIVKVRNSTKLRFMKKCKNLNILFKLNIIDDKYYTNALAGYYGHLSWGNCNKLIYAYSI